MERRSMFILYPSGHWSLRLSRYPPLCPRQWQRGKWHVFERAGCDDSQPLTFPSQIQLRGDRAEQSLAERRGFSLEFGVGFSDSLLSFRFGQVFLRLARGQYLVDVTRRHFDFVARRKLVAAARFSCDGPKPALLFAERVLEQHGVIVEQLLYLDGDERFRPGQRGVA